MNDFKIFVEMFTKEAKIKMQQFNSASKPKVESECYKWALEKASDNPSFDKIKVSKNKVIKESNNRIVLTKTDFYCSVSYTSVHADIIAWMILNDKCEFPIELLKHWFMFDPLKTGLLCLQQWRNYDIFTPSESYSYEILGKVSDAIESNEFNSVIKKIENQGFRIKG